jgi:hypothetical protein
LSKSHAADKYALIISIGTYKRTNLAPIENASRDAKLIGRFLERQGYRTEHLRGPGATRSSIFERFRRFIESPKPQDTVIIYFIGHGSGNSLLPYDADESGSNSIYLSTLVYFSANYRKGKTIYFIDACLDRELNKWTYQKYDKMNAVIIPSKCISKIVQPTFTQKLIRRIKYHARYKPIYLSDLLDFIQKDGIADVRNVVRHEGHETIQLFDVSRPVAQLTEETAVLHPPEFPWPPPRASAMVKVPQKYLYPPNKQVHYHYINSILVSALNKCGYGRKSYFAVPNGFALVTQLEQINEDGTSKSKSERWLVEVQPFRDFSLIGYLKALFTAKRGYFRVIVFIITDQPFSQKESKVSKAQALNWLSSGYDKLPVDIGGLIYTKNHETTALIYEFMQPGHKKKGIVKYPGKFTGEEHLLKSNILFALGR